MMFLFSPYPDSMRLLGVGLHLLSIYVIWPVLLLVSLTIMFSITRGVIRKNNNGMRALRKRLPVMGWLCMVPAFVFLMQAPSFLAQFADRREQDKEQAAFAVHVFSLSTIQPVQPIHPLRWQ